MPKLSAQLLRKMMSISVDGNISSGKSTLVHRLHKEFQKIVQGASVDVDVIPEPIGKWRNAGGHNLLAKYYEDPVKNNFLFQHYVQLTRLQDTITKLKPLHGLPADSKSPKCDLRVRLMERSLQNSRYCFIEMAFREGALTGPEYTVLVEYYDWMEQHLDLSLDLIIYLRTRPEVVHERMRSRGRQEESTVPLKYLQTLHTFYEDWLMSGKGIHGAESLIVVDANENADVVFEETAEKLRCHLELVVKRVKEEAEQRRRTELMHSN